MKQCTALTEHDHWCDCGSSDCWETQLRLRVSFDRNSDREVCILFIHQLLAKERESVEKKYIDDREYSGYDAGYLAGRKAVDDGKPEYTGKTIYLSQIEEAVEILRAKLVDRDTNFGMNESYRMALEDVLSKLTEKV